MTTENQLAVIEKTDLVPFFTKGDHVDDVLAKIAEEARAHVPDTSTLKGRNAIKANITKIKKCKTFLESKGKDLAAEYKAIPKVIDENRRKVKDFLNSVEDECRLSLTEWEDEQARIKAEEEAAKAEAERKEQVNADHELAILMYADYQREQEELRIKAETEQKARDEEIARQAAEQARIEAERKAAEEQQRIENERLEAIRREEQAKAAAEQAKRDAEAAEARRIQDAKDAEERRIREAKEAEERADQQRIAAEIEAKRQAEAAAAEERQRFEREEQERIAEQQRREADKAHRGKINRGAMNGLVASAGLTEEQAKAVVTAIAKGQVPSIVIQY